MTDRDRFPVGAALGAATVGLLLSTVVAPQSGSAARLEITDPGVVQYWELDVDVPATPDVDLSACGDLSQYDDIVYGTDGPDALIGGNGPQVLVGLGGDDVLRGGNQDDCLVGGDGEDELFGENGQDILVGGAGDDLLDGGTGRDTLDGGGQAGDVCTAPPGVADTIIGSCGSPDVHEDARSGLATDEGTGPEQLSPPVQAPPTVAGSDDRPGDAGAEKPESQRMSEADSDSGGSEANEPPGDDLPDGPLADADTQDTQGGQDTPNPQDTVE
jgi:hypothetical protein